MPGMNGIEVINWVRDYLRNKGVEQDDMPRFAFRGQHFFELPPETIQQIFELGIKPEDVIEKMVKRT
jgi:hypothetical protein